MKKSLLLVCLAGMTTLLTCVPAMADASMFFSGPGSNNYQGVPSYPYALSVNGGPLQAMMCISFTEHISGGETWMATATSIGSLDLATHLVDYEAAYLFLMAVADHGTNSDINAAVWSLYEGQPTLDPGALADVALAQTQTYYQGEFAGVIKYTAIPGTESGTLGTPQNFLGTPEPSSLLLMGTGVLGIAGMVRRRFDS